MKKNEYVSPEMEIVEITEQENVLALSGEPGGEFDSDYKPGDF